MQKPNNFLECFCLLDDILTKKELSISKALLWFFKERLVGNHEKTFPSSKKIALMAGCCRRTVTTFIKKYENIIITHISSRNFETGKHNSNQYGFNEEFFETLILLDDCGYLRNWTKKTKIHVIKSYYRNEWFLHEILLCQGELMNNEIAHGFYRKLRTIKNFFLLRRERSKALQEVLQKKKEKKDGFGVKDVGLTYLQGLPLSIAQKRKLASNFGINHLKAGKEAFRYKDDEFRRVDDPERFIFMACRQSVLKTMQRR
jgi:hypothetical protein